MRKSVGYTTDQTCKFIYNPKSNTVSLIHGFLLLLKLLKSSNIYLDFSQNNKLIPIINIATI